MFEATINIKPLSVNDCWKGKRFKTKEYTAYSKSLYYQLPAMKLPDPPYKVYYEFGLSSKSGDWDNPIKPAQDIMQQRYGFDDKSIFEAVVKKVIVEKGKEYFKFKIETVIYP